MKKRRVAEQRAEGLIDTRRVKRLVFFIVSESLGYHIFGGEQDGVLARFFSFCLCYG